MVVSADKELISWMKKFRNYGKVVINGNVVTYPMKEGFNYRVSEFTAALGIVQIITINFCLVYPEFTVYIFIILDFIHIFELILSLAIFSSLVNVL